MKAVVFHGSEIGLKVEDIPVPDITAEQILVKVAACGVCHTDLRYIEHGVPTFKKPPVVLGHEASGIVEKSGAEVTKVREGQRVLVPVVMNHSNVPIDFDLCPPNLGDASNELGIPADPKRLTEGRVGRHLTDAAQAVEARFVFLR